MSFIFTQPKAIGKKKHSSENQQLLDELDTYMLEEVAEWNAALTQFWTDQATAITYKEMQGMIEAGEVSQEVLEDWKRDYAVLVKENLKDKWMKAIINGQKKQPLLNNMAEQQFQFNEADKRVEEWIWTRSGRLITEMAGEQRRAIQHIIEMETTGYTSAGELARMIRPCIGLTTRQTVANKRYYDRLKEKLRADHPRMKESTIVSRAQEAQRKYAKKQLRYRAQTIAHTELAEAYNQGADFGIRQAQEKGYIGHVRKVWVTAREFLYDNGKNRVCQYCEAVEGVKKELDEYFNLGKCGLKKIPPAHPRCRCVVKYVEVEVEGDGQ